MHDLTLMVTLALSDDPYQNVAILLTGCVPPLSYLHVLRVYSISGQ